MINTSHFILELLFIAFLKLYIVIVVVGIAVICIVVVGIVVVDNSKT